MSATGLTRAAVQDLPVGAVVLDGQSLAWQKVGPDAWRCVEWQEDLSPAQLHRDARPLALLFDPSVGYVPRDGAQLSLPLRKVCK